jgi:hypothetical protein
VSDGRQREFRDGPEELVGNLRDDSRAVAGAGVGADGSPVLQIAQGIQCVVDDVVTCGSAQGRDHGEAAGITFPRRVVETRGCRNRTEV